MSTSKEKVHLTAVLKCLATSTAIWNPMAWRASLVFESGYVPNKAKAAKILPIKKAYISILKAQYLLTPLLVIKLYV